MTEQKNWLALATVAALGGLAPFTVWAASPPNIVLILSDDQAWTDYGFMGHAHIKTPNLDRLAADGVTFRRGYVPTALCRPALMTLATGHYAHRHGITGNSPSRNRAEYGGKLYNQRLGELISFIDRFDTLPELLVERATCATRAGNGGKGATNAAGSRTA